MLSIPRTILSCALLLAATGSGKAQQTFAAPIFLLDYKTAAGEHPPSDFRPSLDASGVRVVFERSQFNGTTYGAPFLNVVDLRFKEAPRQIYGLTAARADWCLTHDKTSDGRITFSTDNGIYTVDPDVEGSLFLVPNSKGSYYPSWYPACRQVAVKKAVAVNGGPSTYRLDVTSGQPSAQPLSGYNTWAGFVDVDRAAQQLTVFAGQPVSNSVSYDENRNYIYIADARSTSRPYAPVVTTLEAVPSGPFDGKFQGRAPTFSPDGLLVAFESNRSCYDKTLYAIFIKRRDSATPPRQVTTCQLNAQHARWIPPIDGSPKRYLIVAAYQPRSNPPAFGIAALDVSNFIPQ